MTEFTCECGYTMDFTGGHKGDPDTLEGPEQCKECGHWLDNWDYATIAVKAMDEFERERENERLHRE